MAVEIPPDYFPTSPTLAGADCFPENMSVPAAGIFDAPAHVAIINRDWISRLLGVFDGLMYPEAWEAIGAETAYNELLELQAMLMSPANYLIPSDTLQIAANLVGLGATNTIATLATVPVGERWRLTSINIMTNAAEPNFLAVRLDLSSKLAFPIHTASPVTNNNEFWTGEFWLYPGDIIKWQLKATSSNNSLWVSVSGLVYDEV